MTESIPPETDHAPRLAFIGGGNMARSLIGGLADVGRTMTSISVGEPNADLRAALASDFGVTATADNQQAVEHAEVWILAVKPQAMAVVCQGLAATAQRNRPLVISIAAGITSAQVARWLGGDLPVVRAMPNTPALIGVGMTGLYGNRLVDARLRALAQSLLDAVGKTVWIDDESLMDVVTAVSGSGPAYFFLLVEALQNAGEAQGLDAETARTLCVQTALGAARMLIESGEPASTLRQRVTSPGGTTAAALESLFADRLPETIDKAIMAACRRGAELSAANDRENPQ
ncbi:MAG: pyrroline-5-carboxylate reductase [Xanthomonadaceae bacterium]|nr:pyrroline-5-carboxylate reductase [Xanthomonadaceae bacterium]